MEIVFVTPEITPYSRTNEVGDVCAALPKALRGTGHRVTVISPLWTSIDPMARALGRRLTAIETKLLSSGPTAHTQFDGRTTGGVDLQFLGQPERFGASLNALEDKARVLAALDFCCAAAELIAQRETVPDIVHAHGWFAAGVLPLVKARSARTATVLSVHGTEEHGLLSPSALEGVTLPDAIAEAAGPRASLLRAGLAAATRVIVASQAEARALIAEQTELSDKLVAITHGVDAARWNPVSDPLIGARFDAVDTSGKQACKEALQLAANLPVRADVPLILVAGDLTSDAALTLVTGTLPGILRNDVQIVVHGALDDELRGSLATLIEQYPERLAAPLETDERALHRGVAGADFMLIPALSEALGDLHLCGLRYGTLPIARNEARIADTLVDCDAALTTGTAFLCERADSGELLSAAQRALSAYSHPTGYSALLRRAMRTEVSWERASRRYEHVYKQLV